MLYMEWSKDIETGFGTIDAQHKTLVEMINEVAAALEGSHPGGADAAIEANLRRLLDYTNVHFELEENLMKEANYQGFAEHKQVHSAFRERAQELFARFKKGEDVAMVLLAELRVWLLDHIQGTDMQYIDTFKQNLSKDLLNAK